MHKLWQVFPALVFLVAAAGCAPPASDQDVDQIVQATFQALTAQAEQGGSAPEPGPEPTGSLSGGLGYPSEAIPPLRVAAFDTSADQVFFVDTTYNQSSYQISDLPVGTYHVVAYTLGGGSFPEGLAGGYTRAVPCGLSVECTDHSLIPVTVTSGQDTPGVDPVDWYAKENDFPPRPGPPPAEGTGSISGSLSFPSEFIPPQRVIAFQVGSDRYFYVDTDRNQDTYRIDDLPVGYYQIVAYTLDGKFVGGYTQAVPCGLTVECNNHELIEVPVNNGQVVGNIDPADWYAPEGSFPADPTP